MDIDFPYVLQILRVMPPYVGRTCLMAVLAFMLALVIACLLALIIRFRIKKLVWAAHLYVSFFRSTPLLPQLFFLYYGLPQILAPLRAINGLTAAVVGLALNAAAYMAESIRAALLAVDKGQMEAALSVGMTTKQAMRRIVLPQAGRIAVPPLFNSFVDIVKGTSLAFTLGVVEITAKAQMEAAVSYKFFEAYLAIILVYWALIALCEQVQRLLEKRLSRAYGETARA